MMDTDTERLKACPFCASTDIKLWEGLGTQADITCQDCGCERGVQVIDLLEPNEERPEFNMRTHRYPDWLIARADQDLTEQWNTRAHDSRCGELLEAAKLALFGYLKRPFKNRLFYEMTKQGLDAIS